MAQHRAGGHAGRSDGIVYGNDLESVLQYRMDKRECRERLRRGSRSFYAASLLLPGQFRHPITALTWARVSSF